jgi:peptidoglycan/LPS O-acetylase OafA/YrhL
LARYRVRNFYGLIVKLRMPKTRTFTGKTPAAGVSHIPSLDGVRALAFLIVFVSHAGLRDLIPGGFGVTIFFVLSGYLITTLLRAEFERNRVIDLRAFYLRRSLRILPLLYITLTAAILLGLAGQLGGQITLAGILSQVLHWSNYHLITHGPDSVVGGTIVLWSLAVEEHFYLLFPLLFFFITRRLPKQAQGWLLVLACAGCLAWRLTLILVLHQPGARTELGTDTRFDSLLLGCLMAIVANPVRDNSRWLDLKRVRWASALAIPVLLLTFLYRNEVFRETWRYSLQGVALLPLFAYAIRDCDSFVFRILNFRWMAQLGALSYSLYLIHAIVLEWYTRHLRAPKFVVGVATFITAIGIAKLLQLSVERPLLKFRRALERQTEVRSRLEGNSVRIGLGAPVKKQNKDEQTEVRGEIESYSSESNDDHVGEYRKSIAAKIRWRKPASAKHTTETDKKDNCTEHAPGEAEFQESVVARAGPRCDPAHSLPCTIEAITEDRVPHNHIEASAPEINSAIKAGGLGGDIMSIDHA